MMPDDYHDWPHTWGWHQRENIHYTVAREPKMYRTCSEPNYRKRTVWLKDSQGWKRVGNKVSWTLLSNPSQKIHEWVERGVFVFEMGAGPHQLENLNHVAACLDDRLIDMPFGNAMAWHRTLHDRGSVSENNHDYGDIVSSCCDMINVTLSDDDKEGEDLIDTIEAVTLGPQ